jgi:plasmid stabilization system protein ParE
MGKTVVWSKTSLTQAEEIHRFILEESKSLEIADKLIADLFSSTIILETQPELYSLDKYRKDNNGSYRAYEVFSYRIVYREFKDTIRILRVRHTSRKPLKY